VSTDHSPETTAAPTSPPAELLTEMRGPVLWVTINREERRNAISADVLTGISEAIAGANRNRDVRAVVITGAGHAHSVPGPTCKVASPSSSTTRSPMSDLPTCFARPNTPPYR
jgi:hypothetical protein